MATNDASLPSLQLSDIMHTMSPSPGPQQQDDMQLRQRTPSPEPLTEADIARIRIRVAEMGITSGEKSNASSREKELADMVLRLTESNLLDPSQLIHQANVISGLNAQRDFLVRQAEEERARWCSQKDGFARMAEALIAQRNKTSHPAAKDVTELERHCSALESDNRVLREKLQDTQARLNSLESELSKLRPILLMQPYATAAQMSLASFNHASSVLSSVPYPSVQNAIAKVKIKKRKKEPRVPVYSATAPDEHENSDDQTETRPMEGVEQKQLVTSSSFFQFQTQPVPGPSTQPPTFSGDHYRKPIAPPLGGPLTAPPTTLEFQVTAPGLATAPPPTRSIRQQTPPSPQSIPPITSTNAPATPGPSTRQNIRVKSKRPHGAPLIPLTSDARSEHLLLAARKIGRERAGIVAGFLRDQNIQLEAQRQEREKERAAREAERLEWERSDRLAERGAGGMSYYRRDVVNAGGVGGSPQTPKRTSGPKNGAGGSGVGGSHYANVEGNPHVLGLGDISRGSDGGRVLVSAPFLPQPAQLPNPNTPRQQQQQLGAPSGSQQQAGQGNPPTPLASLLDAARMMNDDGGKGGRSTLNGNRTGTGRRRNVTAVDQPESPAPKRRRVSTTKNNNGGGGGGGGGSGPGTTADDDREGVGRVKSALDVLADQAAAFSSHDRHRGKGKAREVVGDDDTAEDVGSKVKEKGKARAKPRPRAQAKEKDPKKAKPARKPRARAPPKDRTLAPAPNISSPPPGKGNGNTAPALPRMISPPDPRRLGSLGLSSVSSSGGGSGISPLDILPSPKRASSSAREVGHAPPETAESETPRVSTMFSFRPVMWGRPEEDASEEGTSPARPAQRLVDAVREKEKYKDEEGTGEDRTGREGLGETMLGPPAEVHDSHSPAIEFALVSPTIGQESDDEAEVPPVPDVHEKSPSGSPESKDQTSEVENLPGAESSADIGMNHSVDGMEPPTPDASHHSESPPAKLAIEVDQDIVRPQDVPTEKRPDLAVENDVGGPERTVDKRHSPLPEDVNVPDLLSQSHALLSGVDEDRPRDDDTGIDADVDADADGEVDADGDVDAEGDVDLEIDGTNSLSAGPLDHHHTEKRGYDRHDPLTTQEMPNHNMPLAAGIDGSPPSLEPRSNYLLHPEQVETGLSRSIGKTSYQALLAIAESTRPPRSQYSKWTKDEDELLAAAVSKHGQKWSSVQKVLPGRSYHQVRQRWLRKIGHLDNKVVSAYVPDKRTT